MEKRLLDRFIEVFNYTGYSSEGDYDQQTRERVNVIGKYILQKELSSLKSNDAPIEYIEKLKEVLEKIDEEGN